jgi:hypothetical protein
LLVAKDLIASSSLTRFDADYELFDHTFHSSSEMTIPPITFDPGGQILNTDCPPYTYTTRILTPQSDMSLSPTTDLASFPPPSTRHQPKEGKGPHSAFLFVDNSDKETAARLRNVLTNRKQRRQRMSKVAELEEKLRTMESEKNAWKQKAEFWRKALADNQIK